MRRSLSETDKGIALLIFHSYSEKIGQMTEHLPFALGIVMNSLKPYLSPFASKFLNNSGQKRKARLAKFIDRKLPFILQWSTCLLIRRLNSNQPLFQIHPALPRAETDGQSVKMLRSLIEKLQFVFHQVSGEFFEIPSGL